ASGLAFTTNLVFQFWQRIFGHEIAVTNFDPFGKTVVWNLTGSAIHIKTVTVASEAPKNSLVWEVHTTIPASNRADISLLNVAHDSWYGLPRDLFGRAPAEYAQVDDALFKELMQNTHTDKYVPTFLMPESESYAQLKKFLQSKFKTFVCTTS